MVVFFCSVIAIMYHFGVMQAIIRSIGRVLAFGLGTTPAESLNVAGNMFVSQASLLEPRHEKTCFSHIRKQWRRSAAQ